jgi:hypothetical protein
MRNLHCISSIASLRRYKIVLIFLPSLYILALASLLNADQDRSHRMFPLCMYALAIQMCAT